MSRLPHWQNLLAKHCPSDRPVGWIVLLHSLMVASLAIRLRRRARLPLDDGEVLAAAMLHDIGIAATDAPGIDCRGSLPYLWHGVAGADILRAEGVDERYARVAERHTGVGLDPDEARALGLPEGRVYMPLTQLERLICYADCFYSKGSRHDKFDTVALAATAPVLRRRKSFDSVRSACARRGPGQLARFDALAAEFGRP